MTRIKIINRWKYDYLNITGKIEMVPVSWLTPLMLDNVDTHTTDTDGRPVDLDGLAEHIMHEGLIHAGVIEVSRATKHARLIAGNHRIQVLDMAYFPVYTIFKDEFVDFFGDGADQSSNLTSLIDHTIGEVLEAPSKVFLDIQKLVYSNSLPHS